MSKALEAKFVIISVIGPHAGENESQIFNRKINDIEISGKTFWLIKSRKAKPDMVQTICLQAKKENKEVFCIFIEPSSVGRSVPTKISNSAKMFSFDKQKWFEIPKNISPVTGKIDNSAYALIFNELMLEKGIIDLWKYANFFDPLQPIKIVRGASTVCAIKKDMRKVSSKEKIKSRFRQIVAIGKLCFPYGVWLK